MNNYDKYTCVINTKRVPDPDKINGGKMKRIAVTKTLFISHHMAIALTGTAAFIIIFWRVVVIMMTVPGGSGVVT